MPGDPHHPPPMPMPMPTPGPDRPRLPPLDPPMVPFALGGTAIWAVAGLVMLVFRGKVTASGHEEWLRICLAGFLLGFVGLAAMLKHDADRRRRRRASAPEENGRTPAANESSGV